MYSAGKASLENEALRGSALPGLRFAMAPFGGISVSLQQGTGFYGDGK
jgi:hypothetical protein